MDHAVTLTEAQIAFFDREGYLALPRLTSDADVAFLRGLV